MEKIFYNLMTLNAKKILNSLTKKNVVAQSDKNYKIDYAYDISEFNFAGREIISHIDRYGDNALFFQLRKCLPENVTIKPEDILRRSIIFVDFADIFSKTQNLEFNVDDFKQFNISHDKILTEDALMYQLMWLFRDGIKLSFDGNIYKTFLPFDKSNSMARHSQITFIDSDLKEILEKRLLLDLNFIGCELILIKYYAYRGLYLSTAYRIDGVSLNQDTVIVLEDEREFFYQSVFSANKNSDNFWEFDIAQNKELKLKSFDGEGFICPEYAKFVSDKLKSEHNFKKDSHSFQIRMPFTKGVLHEVDFQKFFIEQLKGVKKTSAGLKIKDMFGIERDLEKAKIILTESMFKCGAWLKQFSEISSDPMKYFFDKMNAYAHTLYITTTEARFHNHGQIKLNYQFLSTLDLTPQYFDDIAKQHAEKITAFTKNFDELLNQLETFNNSSELDETEPNSNNETDTEEIKFQSDRDKCLIAVAKNDAFLNDPKIKSIVEETIKNNERDLCIGRLDVAGEVRFLSCDLLKLLFAITEKIEGVQFSEEQKKSFSHQFLYYECFYMPKNKIDLNPFNFYGFLRNPHLSRNEQVILKPYVKKESLYEKYFSHLKGVVMVSAYSTAPMALGGADFDGDLVKVVSDSQIVEAIKRGVYETAENKVLRKLPVIDIPSVTAARIPVQKIIPLKVIIDTFDSKVGLVSDCAFKLSKKEYLFNGEPEEKYKNICAKCTVVVGLEIDAAKTGVHPEKNIAEIKKLAAGKDPFLTAKKIISGFATNKISPIIQEQDGKFFMYRSKDDADSNKIIFSTIENSTALIDALPNKFLSYSYERRSEDYKINFNPENTQYFKFEVEDWRKNLDRNKVDDLKNLVAAYLKIRALNYHINRLKKYSQDTKFIGHDINILKLQYDDLNKKLPCGVTIESGIKQIHAEISAIFKNGISQVNAAIDTLKTEKWHLTLSNERKIKAAKILGITESEFDNLPAAVPEILFNFQNNGYKIFYYVLKEIQARFNEGMTADDYIKISGDDEKNNDNKYYSVLYKIYSDADAEKKVFAVWHTEIIKTCLKFLLEIFDDNLNAALQHFWSIKSKDSKRDFFWNVFPIATIIDNIYFAEGQVD